MSLIIHRSGVKTCMCPALQMLERGMRPVQRPLPLLTKQHWICQIRSSYHALPLILHCLQLKVARSIHLATNDWIVVQFPKERLGLLVLAHLQHSVQTCDYCLTSGEPADPSQLNLAAAGGLFPQAPAGAESRAWANSNAMAFGPYGVWDMKSFTCLMTWKIFRSGSFVGSPSVIVMSCSTALLEVQCAHCGHKAARRAPLNADCVVAFGLKRSTMPAREVLGQPEYASDISKSGCRDKGTPGRAC